jgi:hypothetical protein
MALASTPLCLLSAPPRPTMKKSTLLAIGFSVCALATPALSCTFSWTHYGEVQTKKRLQADIGSKVTQDYCDRYNKTHELVLITDEFQNDKRTLVHVRVGLRKRGTDTYPRLNRSSYRFEDGNFVIAKKYTMAAALTLDVLMDVMSDLDSFVE